MSGTIFAHLRLVQQGLYHGPTTDQLVYNKLLTACYYIKALETTVRSPPIKLNDLVNSLRSSAAYYDSLQSSQSTNESLLNEQQNATNEHDFTDRRFFDQRRGGKPPNPSNRSSQSNFQPKNRPFPPKDYSRSTHQGHKGRHPGIPGQRCYECGDFNCHSSSHPRRGQPKAYGRFESECQEEIQDLVDNAFQSWLVIPPSGGGVIDEESDYEEPDLQKPAVNDHLMKSVEQWAVKRYLNN